MNTMAPPKTTPLPEPPPPVWRAAEAERVAAWKTGRLIDFGYDPEMAALMAGRGVDVHYVQALIVKGASLHQAAEIAL